MNLDHDSSFSKMIPKFHNFSTQNSRKKICVKFLNGKCNREATRCFFRHVDHNSLPYLDPNSYKINSVCLFHLKGNCFYGEHCWYLHPIRDIKYWIIEWFTDRVNFLFNDELNPDGLYTICDFYKIGEEFNFLLSCFRVKKAQISTISINFSTLNFANAYVFNVNCCNILISAMNLQTMQLSLGSFELLLRKQDEINILLAKSIKLKNLTITDLNKMKPSEGKKTIENPKIIYFIRQLKESFLEYFEIEALRPPNEYDHILKTYIFMIFSLIKSQINFLKFSLNQDLTFLINTEKNKIIFTINFSSKMQMKRLMQDFWDGVINLSIFKEVSFNFISDWFSGLYTHEVKINKINNLSYLELDFRRINVNVEQMELLFKDIKDLMFLNHLRVLFPNAYIDSKILISVGEYLKFSKDFLKVFFIKIKIMFINEEDVKDFLMNFTSFSCLQKLELNLDLNMLQLWMEDMEKQKFLENFIRKLLQNRVNLLHFAYRDRMIQFQLDENLETWLLLKRLLVQHLLFMKREKINKIMRREIIYDIFSNIHRKTILTVAKGLKRRGPTLFSFLDMAENESEGAFYERFLQI